MLVEKSFRELIWLLYTLLRVPFLLLLLIRVLLCAAILQTAFLFGIILVVAHVFFVVAHFSYRIRCMAVAMSGLFVLLLVVLVSARYGGFFYLQFEHVFSVVPFFYTVEILIFVDVICSVLSLCMLAVECQMVRLIQKTSTIVDVIVTPNVIILAATEVRLSCAWSDTMIQDDDGYFEDVYGGGRRRTSSSSSRM